MTGLRAGNIAWQEVVTGYDPFSTYVTLELGTRGRNSFGRLYTDIDTLAETAGLDASQEFMTAACNEIKDAWLQAMRLKRADGTSPLQDLILDLASGTPGWRAVTHSMQTWGDRMPGSEQTYLNHLVSLEKALLSSLRDKLTQEQMNTLLKLNVEWSLVLTGYDPFLAQLDRSLGQYDRMPSGEWVPKLDDLATELALSETQKQAALIACNAFKDDITATLKLDLGEGSSMLDLLATDIAGGTSFAEATKRHTARLNDTVPGSTRTFLKEHAIIKEKVILKLSESLNEEQMKRARELNIEWRFVDTGYNPVQAYLRQKMQEMMK